MFKIVNHKKLFFDFDSVTWEKNIAKIKQDQLYLFTSKLKWLQTNLNQIPRIWASFSYYLWKQFHILLKRSGLTLNYMNSNPATMFFGRFKLSGSSSIRSLIMDYRGTNPSSQFLNHKRVKKEGLITIIKKYCFMQY